MDNNKIEDVAADLAARICFFPADRDTVAEGLVTLVKLVIREAADPAPRYTATEKLGNPRPAKLTGFGPVVEPSDLCDGQCCGGTGPFDVEHAWDEDTAALARSVFGPVRSGLVTPEPPAAPEAEEPGAAPFKLYVVPDPSKWR